MRFPPLPKYLLGIGILGLANVQTTFAANGGSYCGNMMCVGATIIGPDTIYTLNTTVPFSSLGWMAVGFGDSMVGSPLMIMWANSDGTITLSQRQATAHAEPQLATSPPRVANVRTDLSSLTGPATALSFSVPSSGQTNEQMIYALSLRKPSSNAITASLQQHSINGAFQLDLTQTVPDIPTVGTSSSAAVSGSPTSSALPVPTQTGGSSNNQPISLPYTSSERRFIAHGILSALGFCFFLPIGVLQARFLRIWWPKWFATHWIIQAGLAGPCIVAGFALAVSTVEQSGSDHFADKHMVIGLILFLLYICQVLYGFTIHLAKRPARTTRPVQNYGHAVLGLGLIALALYQVWLGFDNEWAKATGRDPPQRGLRIFWAVWIGVLGAAYVLGLALLPKQYQIENWTARTGEQSIKSNDDVHPIHRS